MSSWVDKNGLSYFKSKTLEKVREVVETSAPVKSVNGQTGAVIINVPEVPKAYITSSWVSGASWYRVWSDGWIEQGGMVHDEGSWVNREKTVTLPKAFKNTNYNISLADTMRTKDSYMGDGNSGVKSVTTSNFVVWVDDMVGGFYWTACGY